MWTKAKDFFRYGKRIERRKGSKESTKEDGASILFDKMTSTDVPKSKNRTDSNYMSRRKSKEVSINNVHVKNVVNKNNKKTHEGVINNRANNAHKVNSNERSNNNRSSNKQSNDNRSYSKESNKRYKVPSNKKEYNSATEKKQAAIRDNYKGPTCPYCGTQTQIKTAKEHTGNDNNYCYWVCGECSDVSVTTIKGGYLPSGIPANAKTRRLRVSAHKYLYSKKKELRFNNNALNKWISSSLDINVNRAWIGQLSEKELVSLILARQDEIYQDKYAHIFNRIQ